MTDAEQNAPQFNPGDLIEIALRLYNEGGIREVIAHFEREGPRQTGIVTTRGTGTRPRFKLRGQGSGEVEEDVIVRARLTSAVPPGYYLCKSVEVHDLGGNLGKTQPDEPIGMQLTTTPKPPGTPPGGRPAPPIRTKLNEWRFLAH